jgi:fatty-acid desaturase
MFWVSTHRVHHQLSDHEGDPHTPREGGWWAHTGWLLFGKALHAQLRCSIALFARPGPRSLPCLAQQISLDSLTASGLVLFAARLASRRTCQRRRLVLWGVFLRVTLGLHATWLVNSATHLWGSAALKRATTRATTGGSPW